MDTSDEHITFDQNGWCDYCLNFDRLLLPYWNNLLKNTSSLQTITNSILKNRINSDYDCIIGLSGGLDSSYVAYVAKEVMGLRPLLVHVDAGWNTEQAVYNIEKLVDGLQLDLVTEVVDWDTVQRMQLAFLRSGIADQDLVQDASFFSGLYKFALDHGINKIITGSNFSTECCREPEAWGGYLGIDKILFDDIWSTCGDGQPISFKLVDILKYKFLYRLTSGIQVYHPLNCLPYIKKDAEKTLNQKFGWKPFKHKHHESIFTRFYEDYWLPRRFNFDKRKAHFSSLILTGQMTRQEALNRIKSSEIDDESLGRELIYIAKKLKISESELLSIFESPLKNFNDYKNKRAFIKLGAKVMSFLNLDRRLFK